MKKYKHLIVERELKKPIVCWGKMSCCDDEVCLTCSKAKWTLQRRRRQLSDANPSSNPSLLEWKRLLRWERRTHNYFQEKKGARRAHTQTNTEFRPAKDGGPLFKEKCFLLPYPRVEETIASTRTKKQAQLLNTKESGCPHRMISAEWERPTKQNTCGLVVPKQASRNRVTH